MDNKYCLYFHVNSFTLEVFYVGIGISKRPCSRKNRNIWWHRTVAKFGLLINVVKNNLSWEQACVLEKYYISFFGRKDLNKGTLVNLTDGGEGVINYVCTEETANKISKAHIGKKQSKEDIAKRVESFKRKMQEPGYVFWSKGVPKPYEQKIKMSESAKGLKKSESHKTKISILKKKYYETNPHPWIGRTHTEETKRIIKEKRALQTNVGGPKKGSIPWNKGLKQNKAA